MTYEIQPPKYHVFEGCDWSRVRRRRALELCGLTALHSTIAKSEGSRVAGLHVRRKPIETVHHVVRVSGRESVYVNPGVTRCMIGVPKRESDTILNVLFHQIAENVDFRVRFHGNRIQLRSGITGATPHGERPESVEEYEKRTGEVATERQMN
ncbi:hypothetical protein EDD22DRAFT_850443 [Suillus occidentalis]|nr:hypothetical protein EDD22DRAFT_850443 [Suillus occidentalis]